MSVPDTLGLSTYRWNNNLKSTLLLLAFPILLLLLLGVIFFAYGLITQSDRNYYGDGPFAFIGITSVLGTFTPFDLGLSAVYAWWPIVLGIAAIWVMIGYFFNAQIIQATTGANLVERREAPELYNLLENLCISRGMKTPRLCIIESEAMNAYASGINDSSYTVTVTRGLLNALNKDELEAVLAHELTHIMGRDCRLLIVTIVFTGMISFLAQMLWRGLARGGVRMGRSRGKGGGGAVLIMLIAAVAMAIGYVLALILRFALSRRREYLADAGSVDLTKNPDALISALQKIAENPLLPHVPTEARQMFIENPPSAFDLGGLFSTHPPLDKRIQVLAALGGHVDSGPHPWGRTLAPSSGAIADEGQSSQ